MLYNVINISQFEVLMKKIISALLLSILLVSNVSYVSFAENETATAASSEDSKNEKNNRIKSKETKKPSPTPKPSSTPKAKETEDVKVENVQKESDDPNILSESALLIDASTGKVIYEKNADKKMFPASTTKIMTAYLAIKNLDLDTQLIASKTAVDIPLDSSKMALVEGEILSVYDLLSALLIHSANDAANVLAEAVSGSNEEFVALMNKTASDIGMKNTNFENPHGYHDDNHYTTARDMAIIARLAMENPVFAEMVAAKRMEIQPTNKCPEVRTYTTRNMLINKYASVKIKYSYATGIKTGHTDKAGQCLVASASRNDLDLISVVFKAPKNVADRVYMDTINLFEHAYTKYRAKVVLKADDLASVCKVRWASGSSSLVLKTNRDVKPLLPKQNYNPELLTNEINLYENITAPIKQGDELGEVKYFYDGEEVISSKLYATHDVSRSFIKQILSYIFNIWFLLVFGIVVAAIILRRIKMLKRIKKKRRIKRSYRR